eukprot:CAMPEP_0180512020 /NCGR_PEP_ID=MMETSP1036_2-20121128/51353_1 /TAXON_ID=632150 /ORGANISM="Azadinium spinosum, Strain 3D9" /LENGTH=73 /DNA_ID=CAMNT_0022523107 /DNA_START=27 /DNA_END=245 /DNA_ORIENTATION=+
MVDTALCPSCGVSCPKDERDISHVCQELVIGARDRDTMSIDDLDESVTASLNAVTAAHTRCDAPMPLVTIRLI